MKYNSYILIAILGLSFSFNTKLKCQSKNFTIGGNNDKIEREFSQIIIEPIPTEIYDGKEGVVISALVGTAIPFMVDFGTNIIKQDLNKKLKRYSGEFTLKTSEQAFYSSRSEANLPKIKIIRNVKFNSDDAYVNACQIFLSPELSDDKSAFRYKLDTISYSWSKAKTKRKFDVIDVNIAIDLKYVHFDGVKYELRSLRNVSLNISQVNLDGTVYDRNRTSANWFDLRTEWIPFPAAPKAKISGKTYTSRKEVNTEVTNKDGEVVKTSKTDRVLERKNEENDFTTIYDDSVLYEMSVTVKEINPYKFRAEEKYEYFSGLPFDDDGVMLGEIFKLLLEKEDDNNEDE